MERINVRFIANDGDRTAAIKDNWGNQWLIATHVEDVGDEEMKRRERAFRERR